MAPEVGWTVEMAAATVGVSAGAVARRIGLYPFSRAQDGRLDPTRFVDEWRILRAGGGGRPPTTERGALRAPAGTAPQSPADLSRLAQREARAKVRASEEKSRLLLLRRKQVEGRTCDVDEVSATVGELFVTLSERLQAWPVQAAPEIAGRVGCDATALEVALEDTLRAFVATLTADALRASARFASERQGPADG